MFKQKCKTPLFIYCLHPLFKTVHFICLYTQLFLFPPFIPHMYNRDFNNNLGLNRACQLYVMKFGGIHWAKLVRSYELVTVITTKTYFDCWYKALVPKLWGCLQILIRQIGGSRMLELARLKSFWAVHALCTCLN